jgi:protein-S-isoprenylcysteine O-methyltransferase Ste14
MAHHEKPAPRVYAHLTTAFAAIASIGLIWVAVDALFIVLHVEVTPHGITSDWINLTRIAPPSGVAYTYMGMIVFGVWFLYYATRLPRIRMRRLILDYKIKHWERRHPGEDLEALPPLDSSYVSNKG